MFRADIRCHPLALRMSLWCILGKHSSTEADSPTEQNYAEREVVLEPFVGEENPEEITRWTYSSAVSKFILWLNVTERERFRVCACV